MMDALDSHPSVAFVRRYGPGRYDTLLSDDLDVFIIEGHHRGIQDATLRLRASNPNVKILFWNLSLLGVPFYLHLNVDAFLTNSRLMEAMLTTVRDIQCLFVYICHA